MTSSCSPPAYLFPPAPVVAAEVVGSDRLFPVNRIFCVGRNYAAHAREMGLSVDREEPFYFTKPVSALVKSGSTVPYPPGTRDYHYEMELVVAMGQPAFRIREEHALECVYGYAGGLDMTRRDLQFAARGKGYPWDLGKAFEQSAILGLISPVAEVGQLQSGAIQLSVNDEVRQQADISDMIWSVSEIISHLSHFYHLNAGDLIYLGTPAGVGPLRVGDRLHGRIDQLVDIELTIAQPES